MKSAPVPALPWGDDKPTIADIQRLILERICFLDYLPGDRLKEAELATEFGVSRTPVRDAISRISHLGLVETLNGVGTVVVELSPQRIVEVYDVRLHLATLIGQSEPAQITGDHRNRLRDLLHEARALGADMDSRQYYMVNYKLHALTCDLIGNSVLRSFWTQAFFQAASTWHRVIDHAGPAAAQAMEAEIMDMLTALDEGDLAAVGYIQRIHIGYGFKRLRSFLFPGDLPDDQNT